MTAWATLTDARTYWPESEHIPDDTLTLLLDSAVEVCRAFAPALDEDDSGVDIPERYIHANVLAARDAWTARVEAGIGDGFDAPYTVTITALSPRVRQLLRPPRPAVFR